LEIINLTVIELAVGEAEESVSWTVCAETGWRTDENTTPPMSNVAMSKAE
jgi:hypothetical protein